MRSPDWDDLRHFLALVDSGTLSGAARALGVEHTTIARRIDALEASLTVRLFDRIQKGWSLTADGAALIPHARRAEQEIQNLMRAAAGSASVTGVVRISAPPALAAFLLAPRLTDMLHRLPGIDVELLAESRVADLMRREADIALRFRRPVAAGLAVRAVSEIEYGLYSSASYLFERSPPQWEFLGYSDSLSDSPQQQWLEKIRGQRRYRLRSNDLSTLCEAAVAGLGVAVLPHYVSRLHTRLVRVETESCPIKRKLWIVMHQDVRRAARVRAVADELVALFEPVAAGSDRTQEPV
jgi:DNA-binding transcriptional LysR family regulator